jgi:hypothetical protein
MVNSTNFHKDIFSSIENLQRNFASEKIVFNKGQELVSPLPEHKYEEIASVKSVTSTYVKDEAEIKKITERYKGVVQYQKTLGTAQNRELYLLIAMNPEHFDSFYCAIQKIGRIEVKEIIRVDRTTDFTKLTTKKRVLEEVLASLNRVKSNVGKLSDLVSLHDKILEVETKLQELEVDLKAFAPENNFCSVRFSLFEGATEKINMGQIFRWTIRYYPILLLVLFGVLLLTMLDKLSIMKLINGRS